MTQQIYVLPDDQLDQVSGGRKAGGTQQDYGASDPAPAHSSDDPTPGTNGQVYSAFFDGIKKGMGK